MPGMWWVVGATLVVALLATYLVWTAGRVERLQDRAELAARALDAHLLRRAATAAVLAERRYGAELYTAARVALEVRPDEREAAENDLTRQLRASQLDPDDPDTEAVIAASRRLALARQVHTDLVRGARAARGRPLVRLMRMGRRRPWPQYFDIDDPTLADPEDILADRPGT